MGKKTKPSAKPGKIVFRPAWPWVVLVVAITAISFAPMLGNGFTNWDDDYYVTLNNLLRGPDWRGIFTQPVGNNYHPLTILSLALNYQLSELSPASYFLLNYLLHLLNTFLVFRFVHLISGKNLWVAVLTSLIFGIHPMHVESVAWISERKDVLYSFFFLLSMIAYWKYIQAGRYRDFWLSFLWFALSLLSKPAAIVLPLILFLLDYWKDRKITRGLFIEKIPFALLAAILAYITLKVQAPAISGLEVFPLWTKPLFACYGVMIYAVRFIIPYPLSAFHPYPAMSDLGWAVMLSPLFILALVILLWVFRKNKTFVFSTAFFVINLLLVLQVISIGGAIVAERYTYIPYIGAAFLMSAAAVSTAEKYKYKTFPVWILFVAVTAVFGSMTWERTKVWKDSGALWNNTLSHYPDAPVPRGNRASFLYRTAIEPEHAAESDSLFRQAIDDCTVSLKGYPGLFRSHETRGLIYLRQNRNNDALSDADALIRLSPPGSADQALGFSMRGTANMRLNIPDKAIEDFTACLAITPADDNALINRGAVYYSSLRQYDKALEDYSKAIEINPVGEYYANRSGCYYMMGDLEQAKADAQTAIQKGVQLPDGYKQQLGL